MNMESLLMLMPYRALGLLYCIRHFFFLNSLYNKVLGYFAENDNRTYEEIKRRGTIDVFYGDWVYKHDRLRYHPVRQSDGWCFVRHLCLDGSLRKMYLKREMGKGYAEYYYDSLMREQDPESPHCYLNDRVIEHLNKHKGGTVIDVGAAEGIFPLTLTGIYDKCYLFEPDADWNRALEKTFRDTDGIITIRKFVSDHDDEETVSLDSFFKDEIPEDISVIKMDIEGFEPSALKGMENVLKANPQAMLLVCAYHHRDDEKQIRSIMEPLGYRVTPRDGYMFFYTSDDFGPPYKRRGVLEIVR